RNTLTQDNPLEPRSIAAIGLLLLDCVSGRGVRFQTCVIFSGGDERGLEIADFRLEGDELKDGPRPFLARHHYQHSSRAPPRRGNRMYFELVADLSVGLSSGESPQHDCPFAGQRRVQPESRNAVHANYVEFMLHWFSYPF